MILSFLLVAARYLGHLSHYVQVWPLTISHYCESRTPMPFSLLLEDEREIPPDPSLQKGRGSRTCDTHLTLSSRGQRLTALLSQGWSQLPNEAGAPRAAADILLCQLSFFCCWKLHMGMEPRSCVHSLGNDSPCPAPTTGLGHLAGCISPRLVSKSVLIDPCCGRVGGKGREQACAKAAIASAL